MKTIRSIKTSFFSNGIANTLMGTGVFTALAVAFWLSTAPAGQGQTNCTVCHKQTQTLTFACNSLDYRRHLDHGDPASPCNVTPTGNQ